MKIILDQNQNYTCGIFENAWFVKTFWISHEKENVHAHSTQVTRIVNNQEDQTLLIKDYFQGNFVWLTIAIKIGPTLIFLLKTHWLNKL